MQRILLINAKRWGDIWTFYKELEGLARSLLIILMHRQRESDDNDSREKTMSVLNNLVQERDCWAQHQKGMSGVIRHLRFVAEMAFIGAAGLMLYYHEQVLAFLKTVIL